MIQVLVCIVGEVAIIIFSPFLFWSTKLSNRIILCIIDIDQNIKIFIPKHNTTSIGKYNLAKYVRMLDILALRKFKTIYVGNQCFLAFIEIFSKISG
jgi:hypothetical protein